jgi:hypothetical protein
MIVGVLYKAFQFEGRYLPTVACLDRARREDTETQNGHGINIVGLEPPNMPHMTVHLQISLPTLGSRYQATLTSIRHPRQGGVIRGFSLI